MTFEELVAQEVEKQLEIRIPVIATEIEERLKRDLAFKSENQIYFNQIELAQRLNRSVTTIRKWRRLGMPSEPNATGGLIFDINKVLAWQKQNDTRKAK